MELFNSTINTYDEIEDDKYTNEKDHNLVANPSCLQFFCLELVAFVVLPPFAHKCHSFKFSNFDFVLLLSNVTFCPKLFETTM